MKAMIAAALGASLTLAPVSASAQQSKMPSPEQIEAAVLYAMPQLFKGFNASCSGTLSADGFVATNRDRLTEKYALASEGSWPGARDALMQIAAKEAGNKGTDMIANLPDESLRPFVDGIIFAAVASELKPELCADIERGLELLDPLPVENVAGLLGFTVELMERDKARKRERRETLRTELPPPSVNAND